MQGACVILPSVDCPALQHSSTFYYKRYDFRRIVTKYKVCALIFSTIFVCTIFHSKKNWSEIVLYMYIGLFAKYLLFLSHIHETRIFGTDFRKILRYQISWKSDQWKRNCSLSTDRRTKGRRDRYDEANITFSQFCGNVPKNRKYYVYVILHYYRKFVNTYYDPENLHSMSRIMTCLV